MIEDSSFLRFCLIVGVFACIFGIAFSIPLMLINPIIGITLAGVCIYLIVLSFKFVNKLNNR